MKLRHIITTLALTAAAAAGAQNLDKEITIEKEIVPEQRAATRLSVAHATIKPDVKRRELKFADNEIAVGLVPRLTTLDAAAAGPAFTPSPYRGYVAAGYFPAFNAAVSAGYDIIADSATVLNVWTQYDGTSYTAGHQLLYDERRYIDNTVEAGASLTHCFSSWQRLALDATFGWSAVKKPAASVDNDRNIRFGIDGKWVSGDENSGYRAGLHVGMMKYSCRYTYPDLADVLPEPVREMSYGASFGINYGAFRVDADASFLNYSHFNTARTLVNGDIFVTPGDGKTSGVVTLRPGILLGNGTFRADLGAKVQYTVNSGKKFHVAPDVRLTAVSSSKFSAYAVFGGGEHQNTQLSLFELSHFVSPLNAYCNSHIPFTADLGLVIGPFAGASFEIFGGYAIANDWLMPAMGFSRASFTAVDIKGWHAGARASYDYRDIARLSVSFEAAPQNYDRGYYLWRDRAKQVVGVDLTVRPVERLTVNAGWELRGDRQYTYWYSEANSATPDGGYEPDPQLSDLGTISNLKVGASYRLTDAFTVFARGENLLDKKWLDVALTPMQGLTGLVGVEYKF